MSGTGALPGTADLLGQAAASADAAAERAAGLADQLHSDVHTLLAALGGGPPAALAQARAQAASGGAALGEAGAALREAAAALRAFAARTT